MNTNKFLIAMYTIIICVLLVFVIALSFRVVPLDVITDIVSLIYNNLSYLAIVILVCILLLAISVRILILTFGRKRYAPNITTYNEHGLVSISIEAIKNLSLKAANQVKGVKDVKSKIIVKQDDGLYANISMKAIPETDIPLISSDVQTKVKEYIEKYVGITVKEVRIYVQDIFNSGGRVE